MKVNNSVRSVGYFGARLLELYTQKRISRAAAELAFFLILSIFPLLIVLHAMLAQFMPGLSLTLDEFANIIPSVALEVLGDYLEYVGSHNSNAMLTAGIIGLFTASAAAFRSIHNIMSDIFGHPRFHGVSGLIFSFVFSVLFLMTIYFSILVLVSGGWIMNFIAGVLPALRAVRLWQSLKYPLMLVLSVLMIWGLYRLTTPSDVVMPTFFGALLSAVLLVVTSLIFSQFISMSSRYPLVYGSLASIVILMLWMYICGIILIMGNAVNSLLMENRGTAGPLPENKQ